MISRKKSDNTKHMLSKMFKTNTNELVKNSYVGLKDIKRLISNKTYRINTQQETFEDDVADIVRAQKL